VSALPEHITLRTGESIPVSSLEFATSRSGGPGGQNVNKVETKVEVRMAIAESEHLRESTRYRLLEKLATRLDSGGVLRLTSATERTQLGNRRAVLARLAMLLDVALEPEKKRVATRPSRGSKVRRRESKAKHAEKKEQRRWKGE